MSQNNDNDNGSIDYSQLYVYAGPEQPDPSNMTIYKADVFTLFDVAVQANIIGSSHYIDVPGLNYREMTSCRPIDMVTDFDPVVQQYDITDMPSTRIHRQAGPFDVEVLIIPFGDMFSVGYFDTCDLVYTFEGDGPSAPTAITMRETGWETVHSYPEFGVDLWTRTRFQRA